MSIQPSGADPTTQPDREEQIRQLLAYLELHRAQYDLVALRKQLLDAGYSNTLVDEALRRLDGGKTSSTGERPRLFGCIWSFANWILLSAVIFGVSALTNDGYAIFFSVIGIFVVELLVVAAARNSPGREHISRILLWVVIWTVVEALVLGAIAALLFGICVAMFSNL
jgi:hypothetical protein